MKRTIQAFMLGTALFIFSFLFIFFAKREANASLGCQMVSEQEMDEIIQGKKVAEGETMGSLCMNGVKLPYDHNTQKWYVPQSLRGEEYTGNLSFSGEDTMLVISDSLQTLPKTEAVSGSEEIKFVAYNSQFYVTGTIVFTGLPALAIETEEIFEEYVYGKMRVFEPETEEKPYYSASEMGMGYRIRGNFSKNYEKKGYRLKVTDKNKKETNESLMGMREDADWILNALYTDQNRLREKVCIDLWNETSDIQGTRMEYVELFINNSYEGIYGLLEPIDYKQLGLNKNEDYLYKIRDWGVPTDEDIEACQNSPLCLSVEMKCGDRQMTKPLWEPFGEYAQGMFFEDESGLVQMLENNRFYENVIEVGLYVEMICGVDNQYKNQYVSVTDTKDGRVFKKIPWDFDLTWGNVFHTEGKIMRQYSLENAQRIVQDENFERLLEIGLYDEEIARKWKSLRKDVYSEKNIMEKIDENYNLLMASGAYEREACRWPDSEVSTDVSDIKEFAVARLRVLDERYAEDETGKN